MNGGYNDPKKNHSETRLNFSDKFSTFLYHHDFRDLRNFNDSFKNYMSSITLNDTEFLNVFEFESNDDLERLYFNYSNGLIGFKIKNKDLFVLQK